LTSISCELYEMKKLRHVNLSNNYIVDEDSVKIFETLKVQYKYMNDQKQLPLKILVLPMVII